jgi:hypothetical protein
MLYHQLGPGTSFGVAQSTSEIASRFGTPNQDARWYDCKRSEEIEQGRRSYFFIKDSH